MAIDESIVGLLQDMEFSKHQYGSTLLYHNKNDSAMQELCVVFANNVSSIATAVDFQKKLHFFNEAAKQGTTRYPTRDALSRETLLRSIDSMHITPGRIQTKVFHSITFQTQNASQTHSLSDGLELAQEIVFDSLVAKGDADLLELKRGQLLNSIRRRVANHGNTAFNHYSRRFFPENFPLSEDEESQLITDVTLADLQTAFDTHRHASVPVLLYSGKAAPDQVYAAAQQFIQAHGTSGDEQLLVTPQPLTFPTPGDPVVVTGPTAQTHYLKTYPLLSPINDPKEHHALALVTGLLGGGWTSELMQVVREKHHLVYGIGAQYFMNTNDIVIVTEHAPENQDKIDELVEQCAQKIFSGDFTDEQFYNLQATRLEQMIVTNRRSLETCNKPHVRINTATGYHVEKTDLLTPLEEYKVIAETTPEYARECAQKFLDSELSQLFTYVPGDTQ